MKRIPAVLVLCSGLFIGFLCGALITAARSDQPRANYDQVVAQLGDTVITRGEVAEHVMLMKGKQHSQLGLDVLDNELLERAIVQETARRQGVTVSDEEIDQRIKEATAILPPEEVKQSSRAMLEEQFRSLLLVEKMAVISANEQDARDFYRYPGHAYLFARPNMAKLVIIASKNRNHATEAYNRLIDGEDPRAISAELSDDADLRAKRGDVGWLQDNRLRQDISNTIFGLRPDSKDAMKPHHFTHVFTVQVKDTLPVYDPKHPNVKPPATVHDEYWVIYVDDLRLAYLPSFDQVQPAALCYARTAKYEALAPNWFYQQAKAFNATQSWKQITDLSDPGATVAPVNIDLSKYVATPTGNQ